MRQTTNPYPSYTPNVSRPLTCTHSMELDRRLLSPLIAPQTAPTTSGRARHFAFSSSPHLLKAEALRLHFRRTVTGLLKKRTSERMHSHDQWGIPTKGGFLC